MLCRLPGVFDVPLLLFTYSLLMSSIYGFILLNPKIKMKKRLFKVKLTNKVSLFLKKCFLKFA